MDNDLNTMKLAELARHYASACRTPNGTAGDIMAEFHRRDAVAAQSVTLPLLYKNQYNGNCDLYMGAYHVHVGSICAVAGDEKWKWDAVGMNFVDYSSHGHADHKSAMAALEAAVRAAVNSG